MPSALAGVTSNKSCESLGSTCTMKPTTRQQKAIEHDGRNLQLIACTDTRKTEVVARRVVHLLTSERMDSLVPANIVAFTFTQMEAELKECIITCARLALRAGSGLAQFRNGSRRGQHAGEGSGLEPLAQDLARSHCRRLQQHGPRYGRAPGMYGTCEWDR
jgi:hypothetical protein